MGWGLGWGWGLGLRSASPNKAGWRTEISRDLAPRLETKSPRLSSVGGAGSSLRFTVRIRSRLG